MTSVLRMVAARVQASGWGVDDRWPKRQHVKSPFRMGVTREYKRDPQGFGPTLQSRSTRPLHLQWTLHISPGTHVLAVVHHENSNGRNCTPIRWRLEREGFQTTPMPYSWMCDSRALCANAYLRRLEEHRREGRINQVRIEESRVVSLL